LVRDTVRVPAIEPPTLAGGGITLRPPRPDDADAVTAACQDAEIQRWMGVPSPYRREHAVAWLDGGPARARTGEAVNLLIDLDDGTLAGSVSLVEIDPDGGRGEIGYWVASHLRGRGIAARAVLLLRDWAVAELRLRTIEILVHGDNAPSRRVAERCAFTETGELRNAPRKPDPDEPRFVVYIWEA
jgi:RimJ/RimL family protein N-acetyltransferase